MLFQKIKLKNIRSYVEEEIKFQEGISLLSGDIGSGKSTILLAIDFALFGIRRGELSGSALLRNGAQEGFVNLGFSIDNQDVLVKRTLKRTTSGIIQDSGYITINDVTEQLTPTELKQRILTLLDYPPEILNKRSLIYRYTVYTPQEEMKTILLGEKEDRLQTLRKVFNIDKYKIIKDNAKILVSEIKERKRECFGLTEGLEDKKLRLVERKKYLLELSESINYENSNLKELNERIEEKIQEQKSIEEQTQRLNYLKKELEILNNRYMSNEEQKLKNLNQLKLIESQILETNIKVELNTEDLIKSILENERVLLELEAEIKEVLSRSIEIKSKKSSSESIKLTIEKLDFCPLCEQKVEESHKHKIRNREDEKLQKLNEELELFIKKEQELSTKMRHTKDLLQDYKSKEVEHRINKLKLNEVNLKNKLAENIKKEIEDAILILNEISNKKHIIDLDLVELKDTENEFKAIKKDLDDLLKRQRSIEINIASTTKEFETINKELEIIKEEINKKEEARKRLEYYTKLQDWSENFLINITALMEKRIMLKAHSEFNLLFQKWFDMLMEIDQIKIGLDEEFTPIIEQNGHDIDYENLSGGEKTACALAYRLALNQTINNIVSSLNTKDIMILDEPTDGFSSDQLDKLRYVLQELKMKQIIIVSHESKIESFVDNIIKVEKKGHVSRIN